MSAGDKRAAAHLESGETKKRRSSRGQASSLNEDEMDAVGQQEQVEQDIGNRVFWSSFATPLLFQWLADFENSPITPEQEDNREHIIDLLVSHRAARPRGGPTAQLAALRNCWKRRSKETAPPPGRHIEQGEEEEKKDEMVTDGLEEGEVPLSDEAAAAAKPAAQVDLTERFQKAAFAPIPSIFGATLTPAPSGKLPPAGAVIPSPFIVHRCRTCLELAPLGESQWVCIKCMLRGDLPTDAPENKFLVERRRAPQNQAPQLGQHTSDTHAHAPAPRLTALELTLARMAEVGVPMPIFTGGEADRALHHRAALAEARKALYASASAPPHDLLIAAIRAGKLSAVGYAIPKALAAANDEELTGALMVADGVITTGKGKGPPPVLSLEAFCSAMFGTILPALIDRPMAMMQWITLARTALEVQKKHGWQGAMAYVDQLLNERIPQGLGFSEVSGHCLQSIEFSNPRGQVQQQQAPAGSPRRMQTCRDWNFFTCPRGEGCRFTHLCTYIDRCGNRDPSHRGRMCSFDNQAARAAAGFAGVRPPRGGSGSASRSSPSSSRHQPKGGGGGEAKGGEQH